MAPVNVFPALVIPMTAAVWLIDGSARAESGGILSGRALRASVASAASAGWWWGFGYFVAGLWWLGSAFLVEPDKFVWLMPLGVLGLPAYLAIFPALGFAVARLVWPNAPGRVLVLAACLAGAEWLRGTLLTGFPWNEFGMALGGNLVLGQAASLIGVHGLTLVAVLLGASPAALGDPRQPGALVQPWAPLATAAIALALLAGFGAWRLATPPPGDVAGVKLRIVQPNATIDQDFSYAHKDAILQHYLTLSDRATSPTRRGLSDVTHLIWPESPFPFVLSREPDALAAIGAALPEHATLITGAARLDGGPPDTTGHPTPLYFNAVQVLASGGTIVDSYDKVHLVPFGEFLPLGPVLRGLGLRNFVEIPGGFEAGRFRRLLHVPGLPPVAPIVCYEAIFSGEVVPSLDRSGGERPGLLLNVTNDSWFGFTAGPYQHLAHARLRSIEQGLPLVRAASTGISAVVDSYGRIVASLPLGAETVLDTTLPAALPPPVFARYGNLVPLSLGLLSLGLGLAGSRALRQRHDGHHR